MKKLPIVAIAFAMAVGAGHSQEKMRQIVVDREAPEATLRAAAELQSLLGEGGIHLKIASRHDAKPRKGCIYVGCHTEDDVSQFNDGGFVVASDGRWLTLDGKGEKGTLYAVYDYLEQQCGYRLYAPDALVITRPQRGLIEPTYRKQEPAFAYREVLEAFPNQSQRYADWHHLHTRADLFRNWGLFVHTFGKLVPAERYFDAHPEWFSECDGRRVSDGQLCLSNGEVLEVLCRNLAAKMKENPTAKIWSVSNNDNYNVCRCPDCLRMDSLYGGPTGTLLHFVNQVARRFPDKTISTLAYQYTRHAPEGYRERPDSNVNIMFCSIECGRTEPIITAPSEASFRKDMDDWRQLTDNIFMWDYVVQFRNLWDPFPNLHILQPNLQYFRDHGVRMMFEQGAGEGNHTSWMELRTYLIAKLMWNPDADIDSLTTDFCQGYYGQGGRFVRAIIDTMSAALMASGQTLGIYGYPIDAARGYLSPERMLFYRTLMDSAYAATSQESHRQRLRYFELSLDFATIELEASGFSILPNRASTKADLRRMAHRMAEDMEQAGVEAMMEMGISPTRYAALIDHYLDKTSDRLSIVPQSISLRTPPTPPYTDPEGYTVGQTLADGQAGLLDYRHAWLGFFGDTMDATLRLSPQAIAIDSISMDFFYYPLSWIFLPQHIEYWISSDSINWEKVGDFSPESPKVLATPSCYTFTAPLPKGSQARFIRVVATPLPSIPSWHRAAGHPAWIFTDEVVVR